jgi:hypothetical protein
MQSLRIFVGTALAAAFLVTGAAAAERSHEPAIKDHMRQVHAKVEAVDRKTRVVRLNGDQGPVDIVMPPEVRNFDQIKVGDTLQISYYTGVAAQIKKKGDPVTATTDEVVAARAEPGAKPGAAVGRNISTTVKIESVDTAANTVTFKRMDGTSAVVDVESAEGRNFIKTLRKGDDVDIVYTEAVAIEVLPAK